MDPDQSVPGDHPDDLDDGADLAPGDLEIVRAHVNPTASLLLQEASGGGDDSLSSGTLRGYHSPVDEAATDLGTSFASILAGLWGWTDRWSCHALPTFHAVRHIHPEPPPLPQLGIQGPDRSAAPVRFSALMNNPTNNTWLWSRNWTTVSKLPAAPRAGKLFYQFCATAALSGDSGAADLNVWTTVYFGIVADSSVTSPYLAPGYNTPKGYPAQVTGAPLFADSGATLIEGSVPVRAGQVPSVAITMQVDVLMGAGWARLAPYQNSLSVIPATPSRSAMHGCLEYRYEPEGLIGSLSSLHRRL